MTPTEKYSEFVTENGMDLEIRGESFKEPIKRNEDHVFHTRIEILQIGNPTAINTRYFKENSDADELKILVSWAKEQPQLLKEST